MIELRVLRIFLAVAESRSFTLAAKHLEKTQSAVSQAVRQLEEELGVVLIDRDSRPMALTASGLTLRDRAYQLLEDADALVGAIREQGNNKIQEIRVGVVDSFAAAASVELIEFLLGYATNLSVWTGMTARLGDALMQHKVDMIITNDSLDDVEGLDRFELLREPFVMLAPKKIASAGGALSLPELARNYPMIRYNPHSILGMQIERLLRSQNVHATRQLSVDQTDTLVAMVAGGIGWSITTPLCLLQARTHLANVDILPLGEPLFFRRLVLASRSGEYGDLTERLAALAGTLLATRVFDQMKLLIPWVADKVSIKYAESAPVRDACITRPDSASAATVTAPLERS
ncbi:LysR family transcriptional regulator [Caballeronia sp. dw_19]|uniref:LysR family transcriptional regulator n=1 Tax=Caballeronia sp. dw_19 TaxID=2719791 RepID=UPI001BD560AE|nr:LysR family transcriptional regulator [Caballeronia sp. dw_19]